MTQSALRAWRRWWFAPRSLVDLGVARVCLAAILLVLTGSNRYLIVGRAWGDHWDPVEAVKLLGLAKPELATMQLLAWVTTGLLVMVGVGLFTRVALLALLLLFFVQEALLMSFGKTSHATIPILYALSFFALAPCNRRVALDAVVRRKVGHGGTDDEASEFARWPIELFYVVLAGFYFSAGVSKLLTSGIRWADGWTLQYHLLFKGVPLGLEVARHPWLCALGSTAVLAWQLTFPLGLVRRLRPFYLSGGVAFHLSTGLLMDVWFWPLPSLYTLFVPWSRVGAAFGRLR